MTRIQGRWLLAITVTLVGAGATPGHAAASQAPTPIPTATTSPTANPPQPGTASFGMSAGQHGKTTLDGDHFTYAVPAGSTVSDTLVLNNYRDQPAAIRVYPADLLSVQGGGLAPAQATDPKRSAGGWIHLDAEQVTVPARGSLTVPFQITVPPGSNPGDHLAAVVGSTIAGQTTNGLALEMRVALQVRVRVVGVARVGLSVDLPSVSAAGGGQRFHVTVHNTGNVLLTVDGALTVGGERLNLTPTGIYVIPGGQATFDATWADPPAYGRHSAVAVFTAQLDGKPAGEFTSPPRGLTFIPWTGVVTMVLLAAGPLAAWLLTRTRRHRWIERRRADREIIARHRAAEADTQ